MALIRRLGTLAAQRMRDRYEAIAAKLGVTPTAGAFPGALPEAYPEPRELAHLATTLMFAQISPASVAEIASDARRLFAARGALVLAPGVPPPALYVVVHGAVEVAVRGPDTVQRVRLAGPGRAVGHLGVLGTEPAVAEARARERTVLLELPWPHVHALLDGATDRARVRPGVQRGRRARAALRREPGGRAARGFRAGRRAAAAGPGALAEDPPDGHADGVEEEVRSLHALAVALAGVELQLPLAGLGAEREELLA